MSDAKPVRVRPVTAMRVSAAAQRAITALFLEGWDRKALARLFHLRVLVIEDVLRRNLVSR
jgi:hypothetical protein